MIRAVPRWKVEILADRAPLPERWETLRHESGREYKYVDKADAEAARAKILEHQPHMKALIRVAAMCEICRSS